jgi:hypothetical protein
MIVAAMAVDDAWPEGIAKLSEASGRSRRIDAFSPAETPKSIMNPCVRSKLMARNRWLSVR